MPQTGCAPSALHYQFTEHIQDYTIRKRKKQLVYACLTTPLFKIKNSKFQAIKGCEGRVQNQYVSELQDD